MSNKWLWALGGLAVGVLLAPKIRALVPSLPTAR